jgi:hypothetical protein
MPAEAGVSDRDRRAPPNEIPAFAGMTAMAVIASVSEAQGQDRLASTQPPVQHETMRIGTLFATVIIAFGLAACHSRVFQDLPDGVNSVNLSLASGKWTVTVRNQYGSVSDTIFAANDHQRSNLYLTPNNQLVVIEQGGDDAFFKISGHAVPEVLNGNRYTERDVHSDDWRYIGVIRNDALTSSAECISLLGVGSSPYRKRFQVPSFC